MNCNENGEKTMYLLRSLHIKPNLKTHNVIISASFYHALDNTYVKLGFMCKMADGTVIT